jgi:hypothetical protein
VQPVILDVSRTIATIMMAVPQIIGALKFRFVFLWLGVHATREKKLFGGTAPPYSSSSWQAMGAAFASFLYKTGLWRWLLSKTERLGRGCGLAFSRAFLTSFIIFQG